MEIEVLTLLSVPVVVGLVQAVKSAVDIPTRLLPVLALVVSAVLAAVVGLVDENTLGFVTDAIAVGLAASGLYDLTKTAVEA